MHGSISEKQLYKKFLKLKPNVKWKSHPIPQSYLTDDAALILSDIDINNLKDDYGLHCDLFIHPGKYLMGSSSSFAFQKDSPLKEIIDYQLLKFFQSGLLEQLVKKYFKMESHVCEPEVKEIDFKATFLSFAILGCGVLIAFVVSLLEKINVWFSK